MLFRSDKDPSTVEYQTAIDNLRTLAEARSFKNEHSIGMETKWIIAAGVIQFLATMLWERSFMLPKNAISNWLIKPKL